MNDKPLSVFQHIAIGVFRKLEILKLITNIMLTLGMIRCKKKKKKTSVWAMLEIGLAVACITCPEPNLGWYLEFCKIEYSFKKWWPDGEGRNWTERGNSNKGKDQKKRFQESKLQRGKNLIFFFFSAEDLSPYFLNPFVFLTIAR